MNLRRKKLVLTKETVRTLSEGQLGRALGGAPLRLSETGGCTGICNTIMCISETGGCTAFCQETALC